MDGRKELAKMDLEIMHSLNREWSGERMRATRRNDFEQAGHGSPLRPVLMVVASGLVAALLIGLTVTAVGGAHLAGMIALAV